jgi:copper homeostasis protein
MPGSGIRSNNIQEIAEFTGAEEFHSSAKKMIINDNVFNKRSMQEKNENLSVDEAAIEAMKKTLQQIA